MYNLYVHKPPKNNGSWNTNIIIDIYIYPVMYIPPHSTRSGTNPISTSLPKKNIAQRASHLWGNIMKRDARRFLGLPSSWSPWRILVEGCEGSKVGGPT